MGAGNDELCVMQRQPKQKAKARRVEGLALRRVVMPRNARRCTGHGQGGRWAFPADPDLGLRPVDGQLLARAQAAQRQHGGGSSSKQERAGHCMAIGQPGTLGSTPSVRAQVPQV